jgi:hypothetical protein
MQTILIIFAVYGILDLIFSTILYAKNPYLAQEVLRTVKSLFKRRAKECLLDNQSDCNYCGNCEENDNEDEDEQCCIEDDECVECGVCGKSFDEDFGDCNKYDENDDKNDNHRCGGPDCGTVCKVCDCLDHNGLLKTDCNDQYPNGCGNCDACVDAMVEHESKLAEQDHQLNDSEESMMKYKGEE